MMRFFPEVTRKLIFAFLRDTSCKAVSIDGLDACLIQVERGAQKILFEITENDLPSDRAVSRGVPVYAVANFPQAQIALEDLGWRPAFM